MKSAGWIVGAAVIALAAFIGFYGGGPKPVDMRPARSSDSAANEVERASDSEGFPVEHLRRPTASQALDTLASLRIAVRDSSGSPVPGVELFWLSDRTRFIAETKQVDSAIAKGGEFQIPAEQIHYGEWITARVEGFAFDPQQVQDDVRRVVLVAKPLSTLLISVRDDEGEAVTGAAIAVSRTGIRHVPDRPQIPWWTDDGLYCQITGRSGEAVFQIPDGAYRIRVKHRDMSWAAGAGDDVVVISGDEAAKNITMRGLHACSIRFDSDIEGHSTVIDGAAFALYAYWGDVRQVTEKLEASNPGGIVAVVVPGSSTRPSANVSVWVPGLGIGVIELTMQPWRQCLEPRVVDIEEFTFSRVETGRVLLRDPGAEWPDGISLLPMSPGHGVASFSLTAGQFVEIPSGKYTAFLKGQEGLTNVLRDYWSSLTVSAESEMVLSVPNVDICRVSIRCSCKSGRALPYASVRFVGGARQA